MENQSKQVAEHHKAPRQPKKLDESRNTLNQARTWEKCDYEHIQNSMPQAYHLSLRNKLLTHMLIVIDSRFQRPKHQIRQPKRSRSPMDPSCRFTTQYPAPLEMLHMRPKVELCPLRGMCGVQSPTLCKLHPGLIGAMKHSRNDDGKARESL